MTCFTFHPRRSGIIDSVIVTLYAFRNRATLRKGIPTENVHIPITVPAPYLSPPPRRVAFRSCDIHNKSEEECSDGERRW